MTIASYPITKVKTIPHLLEEHGYQIWYWPVRGSALNCPLEPLTPEFWRKKRKVRLMFGNFLPAVREQDRGDLLILLTQSPRQARGYSYGDLTTEEAITWYDFLLRKFLRVTDLGRTPVRLTESLIDKFEKVFELYILPTRDEKGEYHRYLTISYDGNILPTDTQGMFPCPRCKQVVGIDRGLWVLDKYYDRDGSILLFSVCECCGEMIQLSIDSPNRWRLDKIAARRILSTHNLPEKKTSNPVPDISPYRIALRKRYPLSKAVRRVPLGFDWPIDKPWWGYALGSIPCQTCNGSGKATSPLTPGILGKDHIWYINPSDDCPTCHGTGQIQPKIEIPMGPGYQLWDTTEGSPISPVFPTPEELAQWLADRKRYPVGYRTLSYETWLDFIYDTGGTPA